MYLRNAITSLAALVPLAHGHIVFVRLAHNGVWQEPLRYIRNKTAPYYEAMPLEWDELNWGPRGYNYPTYAIDHPDSVRCGRANVGWGGVTETLRVRAGDTLEFAHTAEEPHVWGDGMFTNCPKGRGVCTEPADWADEERSVKFIHDGPIVAHLSAVPNDQDLRGYRGDGEWVKIHTLGLDMRPDNPKPVHWLAHNYQGVSGRMVFKIPEETPNGKYLLRVDHVYTGTVKPGPRLTQLYPSCAQIDVLSTAAPGKLPKGVLFPEALMPGSPGMTISLAMFNSLKLDDDYVYPGGPLWTGKELIQDAPSKV